MYALWLSLDACFKLKCKNRGLKDPELGSGFAYLINQDEYRDFLGAYVDELEVSVSFEITSFGKANFLSKTSTCDSTHNAVVQALTRKAQGYIATGIAGVKCARHGLVLANGMGDLQKGER